MSGRHDFDFLLGRWQVHNRKLRERLTGCEQWDCFDARLTVWSLLGGLANVDEFTLPDADPPFHGATLRIYHPGNDSWSLYWVDSAGTELQPPVRGRFIDRRGEFYSREQWQGTDILVRFLWLTDKPDCPRWEQAFSTDNGREWETNWVMEFRRATA